MSPPHAGGEAHTLRGTIDRPALTTIRSVFEKLEPLATPSFDDFLNPSTLEVTLNDGLRDADTARLDVQWTTRDDYKFHYTDPTGVDLRWGTHPHSDDYHRVTGIEHYHPPPDANSDPVDVEDSSIEQRPEVLVTQAVIKLWRTAYHADSYAPLTPTRTHPDPLEVPVDGIGTKVVYQLGSEGVSTRRTSDFREPKSSRTSTR